MGSACRVLLTLLTLRRRRRIGRLRLTSLASDRAAPQPPKIQTGGMQIAQLACLTTIF
jgi:hypothetical protein